MEGDTPMENFNPEDYIETREYKIKYNDNNYNILIGLTNSSVILRSLHYGIEINKDEFTIYKCETNEELFKLFNSIFEQNKVIIKHVKSYQEISLLLSFKIKDNKEEKYEINMMYYKQNIEHITNYLWNKVIIQNHQLNQTNKELKQLKDKYNNILNEINLIKNQIQINNYQNNIKNNLNSENNQYLNINNKLNNNINNDLNDNNNDLQNNFYILVKESGREGIITLENCSPKEKVSDLMNKYKYKIKNNNLNFYFLYNTIILQPNMTLEEANLTNLETIEVIKING